MRTEKLTFTGHAGDTLAARLDIPDVGHLATALFAHCFTCGKDIAAARRISGRLAAMGIAVLRFDFTGLGHSGGEFANTHFTSNVEDLVLAAQHLGKLGHPVDLLIGHSLGGAAVLKAAGQIPSARAVVTIGAPADPGHVAHNFSGKLEQIQARGAAKVDLAGRPFTITRDFLEDISSARLKPAIADLKKALLVLHAPTDQTVGIDNAAEIFMAAKHPKSFVTLDDADHLLTRAKDAEYAAEVISAWCRRYLDIAKPAAPVGAPEGIVRVSEVDADGFLQDVVAGPRHYTRADEPKAYGGTDAGMTPYQFLSAGLGACTSMTIRMYARRKGWPLEHVAVEVTHDKVHAADCDGCTSQSGKIDKLTRRITLDGALDEAQRTRLMEIANKCPVHRTLESKVVVETSLAPATAPAEAV
ncbi:bifunctional alpha/beta hydrolase/OsmC family protein [Oceanibium sediminis]|uniref:bifunctional alpha/beta hydrolase/OsmC family protein n=1 Tax=Oceanibium sediminis TaxID=2026339 RepID=UPI000DD300D5|nr:bifunctional alpha/beta hydrolase/OsmC family protein [Oceanibium sediminis]